MKHRNLAIGSVFTGFGTPWYKVQMDFLHRTTKNFDHFVYLNKGKPEDFDQSVVIGVSNKPNDHDPPIGNHEHIEGMHALADFFESRRYRRYLILDSDCFPVRDGWMQTLDSMLVRFDKRFAAPVRFEELNTFAHPSAVYTADPKVFRFHMAGSIDLIGDRIFDTLLQDEDGLLPLVKSNQWCRHPLIGSVYSDLFYHHGAGSRHFTSHGVDKGYWSHLNMDDSLNILGEFRADPWGYVQKSRGKGL